MSGLGLWQRLFLTPKLEHCWAARFKFAVILLMAALWGSMLPARGDSVPPGCTGSALGINLFTDSKDVHIGETIRYSVVVFNGLPGSPEIACDAANIVAAVVTPDGISHPVTLVRTRLSQGQSDFYENVVSYVVRGQDILPDGTVRATASTEGTIHQNDTDSRGGAEQGLNSEVVQPCIQITAVCVGGVGENGQITFTGTVRNCGNAPLDNVTVTNQVNGGAVRVIGPIALAIGQSATFSGSWTPANPCVPSTAVFVATGTDSLTTPRTVTASTTTVCENALTPGIEVTKVCPVGPVSPGQLLVYTGTVRNTGNVTLTNVTVVSDQPANTTVLTLATLAPGAAANFSGSYTAPVDCSTTSGVVARGTSVCGVPVTDSASSTCPIVTNPQIAVTTVCPPDAVAPGGVQTYTGTVRNTGNIPLKNVVVRSDRPAANTTVFTVATLAPGASANFTGSYTVPLLNACAVTTTVVASGQDFCTDAAVTATSAVTCGVTTAPQIAVTLNCPAVPVATGARITYSGTVSNPGNVTLNNVSVVNTQASPTTVFTVASLAPGASANFTTSFTAAAACSVTATVTASGSDACSGVVVTDSESATCTLVTTPRLVITQDCPTNPAGPGGQLTYTGTVRNTGDITVTNVVIRNDLSGANPVFTAATLAPGASANFTGSFVAPLNACAVTSTSTVTATSVCGVAVTSAVSSTCPILTAPLLTVTVACPTTPITPGAVVTYSGRVNNGGNITLTNVVVVSDRPAANTVVFTAATLAPGASANFTGSYTVPADACSITAAITATARDLCSGNAVNNTATLNCPVTTAPQIAVTLACPTVPAAGGAVITYTGTVRNAGNVTLNNVTVVNTKSSPQTVFTVASLAPGASANFTTSFTTPGNACDVSATVTASGSDRCTATVVSASASATCPLTTAPQIAVTQLCPVEPATPGGTVTFTGTVRNTGNITLTNVVVLGNQTAPVVIPEVPTPTTVGLVGYWALNEASGNTAVDSSGSGNAGTLNNATRVAGSSGNGLSFNGVNSSVIIPNSASLNFTGPITLAAWVKPGSVAGKQNILAHGYTLSPARSLYLRINDGRYEVGAQQDTTQPTASAPMGAGDLGNFVHIAGVYNGSAWIIYRNGVALGTFASPMGAVQVDADWAIGARDGGTDRNFAGVIDEARIYNRALTAAEILVLAGQVTTPPVVDPVPSTPVFTVASLAPGASANFTVNRPAPASGCSITSTLVAAGRDLCTGQQVTANVTTTCELVTAPDILVTLACPATPPPLEGTLNFTGTVKNTGNSTLTNVVVVQNRTSTNVTLLTLASLAPGASANFSGSQKVPPDCCALSTTVTATGGDCSGVVVRDTTTITCPVLTAPAISITKLCPPEPVNTGDVFRFTGTISNTGNVTLVNVIVMNAQPGANVQVFGPISLAPGESVDYSASYIVPPDFCAGDSVTVTAEDICGKPVSDSASTVCPIVTSPGIEVIKDCPAEPTPRGGTYTYSGRVINTGNVTLVNVFVFNSQPTNGTPVLGPITLAPGESRPFSGSYVPHCICCEIIDTVTARGQDRCTGTTVSARATDVCPLLTTPRLAITKICPTTPVPVGGTFTFRGSITNTGDITLTNVVVVSGHAPNVRLVGPIELAPGESEDFTGSYVVTAGTDPAAVTLTVTGKDICLGRTVTAIASCTGLIGGPDDSPVITTVLVDEGTATVTWSSSPGVTYKLQWKADTKAEAWTDVPGTVTGNGHTVSKTDAVGENSLRFYRVTVVE